MLINLLGNRDQWLSYIHLDLNDDQIKIQLEHQLSLVINDSLQTIYTIFPQEHTAELIALARYAADNLARTNTELSSSFEIGDIHNKQTWLSISHLLLTDKGTWRKTVDARLGFLAPSSSKNKDEKALYVEYKNRFEILIAALQDNEKLRSALFELTYLPDDHYQTKQWEALQALLQVLKIVAAQLRLTFQQYGKIDFIENAQAALLALGNDDSPTDLALALDYQIKHILVDEFQDTSFTQYQLLEKLTTGWTMHDGRTLFVVGDPMQSIYRFRQAEVGLFIRMCKNGIGNIKLIPLTLTVNFRSSANLVDWNNAHFTKIFPSFNDIATGAVSYCQSVAKHATDEASNVTVRGFINANEVIQAQHIIDCIRHIRIDRPDEKIAILARSRTHLSAIIPALKKANMPYQAIDIEPLAARQVIHDLFSLTCALTQPADRIAWLAILRAPWCGLSLADLLTLAGDHASTTIWQQLENKVTFKKLTGDGQQRLSKIIPRLKSAMIERERNNMRCWIENTWLLLGGPACLLNENDIEDANAFFNLLDECNRNHQSTDLEKLKNSINRLYANSQHDDASLQIMTIHTAKGLEFDTVIIPHLERKIPNDDKSLFMWMERPLTTDETALLLAPIYAIGEDSDPIYDYIRRQQKIKYDYEIDRLLYVAATRAKRQLYLFFNAHENNKIESNSFLDKLWPHFEKLKDSILTTIPSHHTEQTQTGIRSIRRICSEWQNPIRETSVTKIAYHQQAPGFQLSDHTPKIIGTVIHSILQHIAEQGQDWWLSNTQSNKLIYIQKHLRQLGIGNHDITLATNTVTRAIQHTLQDERGLWILQAHEQAKSEFAMTAIIDGVSENLIIDRTFITPDGVRWIIDYKTTIHTDEDLKCFLDKEQEKYAKKMQAYYQAMQLMDKRPTKLGLYFTALPAWREWEPITHQEIYPETLE